MRKVEQWMEKMEDTHGRLVERVNKLEDRQGKQHEMRRKMRNNIFDLKNELKNVNKRLDRR